MPTDKQLQAMASLLNQSGFDDADSALRLAADALGLYGSDFIIGPDGTYLFYANSGDTYAPTVCYDSASQEYGVMAWGDWLEEQEQAHAIATGRVKCGHCSHWTPVQNDDWRTTECDACHKLVSG